MKFAVIFLLSSFFLCSCIDVESSIQINEDRSGTFFLTYKISRMAVNLGREEDEKDLILFPASSEELQAAADEIDGLNIKSFTITEKAVEIIVNINLEFDDINSLSSLFEFYSENSIEYIGESPNSVFRHIIYTARENSIDSETLTLIDLLIPEYSLSFIISTPGDILSAKILNNSVPEDNTKIGDTQRSAGLQLNTMDVVRGNNTIIWEVVW